MLKAILEALLFVVDEPLSLKKLSEVTGETEQDVEKALEDLRQDYESGERGIHLKEVAGGYRFYTHPGYASYVEKLVLSSDFRRLTQAALETLAIIAYKQPLTRAEIKEIRGVSVDSVLNNLISKGLVQEVGREQGPGQPALYGTTKRFLESFGLGSLDDLPPLGEFEPAEETKSKIRLKLQQEA
ncbi:MAG: SMC-Scp complex subunit ScpB [Actinomycetota bacterium]